VILERRLAPIDRPDRQSRNIAHELTGDELEQAGSALEAWDEHEHRGRPSRSVLRHEHPVVAGVPAAGPALERCRRRGSRGACDRQEDGAHDDRDGPPQRRAPEARSSHESSVRPAAATTTIFDQRVFRRFVRPLGLHGSRIKK
jgi:hypothetical protein